MSRAPVWLLARLGLHAAFLSLWVVWLSGTEKPSQPFALLLGAAAVALLAPLLVPRARERWLAWLRRAARPLDVLSINLVLLLVLFEAGARVLQAVAPSPLLVEPNAKAENAIRAQQLPPGSVYRGFPVNALGFVDQEFQRERTPGVRRIVALGDSFAVAAVPYRENFLTVLDDLLDRDGAHWEVLNFGVSGVSPREYLHIYRTQARFFEPDLVLLCFFNGNDFRELRASSPLHGGSLYFFAIAHRLLAISAEPRFSRDRTDSLGEETFRAVELSRVKIAARDMDGDTAERYPATFRQLREIAAELGPRLRVVIIPDEYQVNARLLPDLLGAEAAAAYDVDQPTRLLREFLDAERIPYLDLLPPLREAEAHERTYIPNNTHWNARGNRVAAEALAQWLGAETPPD